MSTDFRALCRELTDVLAGLPFGTCEELVVRARAALAEPVPPVAGELGELVKKLRSTADGLESQAYPQTAALITRAAELLAQRHPAPVPVSERPWEREGWCDDRGRCWFGTPEFCFDDAIWTLHPPAERLSKQTVCLPATALPLPQQETTNV